MLRSNSKSLGNHVVSPEEEKERLRWEGFAEIDMGSVCWTQPDPTHFLDNAALHFPNKRVSTQPKSGSRHSRLRRRGPNERWTWVQFAGPNPTQPAFVITQANIFRHEQDQMLHFDGATHLPPETACIPSAFAIATAASVNDDDTTDAHHGNYCRSLLTLE